MFGRPFSFTDRFALLLCSGNSGVGAMKKFSGTFARNCLSLWFSEGPSDFALGASLFMGRGSVYLPEEADGDVSVRLTLSRNAMNYATQVGPWQTKLAAM